MLPSDFLTWIGDKAPPAPKRQLWMLEMTLGHNLPDDYRAFLLDCNGGYVGGALWFKGPTPSGGVADAGVHHVGGFRNEDYFSLDRARRCYRGRIPENLMWIMDDPFGNAICLGVSGVHRGKVYFWDHELEPDDGWDGQFDTAGNLLLLANSFTEFVSGLAPNDHENMDDDSE